MAFGGQESLGETAEGRQDSPIRCVLPSSLSSQGLIDSMGPTGQSESGKVGTAGLPGLDNETNYTLVN